MSLTTDKTTMTEPNNYQITDSQRQAVVHNGRKKKRKQKTTKLFRDDLMSKHSARR